MFQQCSGPEDALSVRRRGAQRFAELAEHFLDMTERDGLQAAHPPKCLVQNRERLRGSLTARREVIDIGCPLIAFQARRQA